MSRPRRRGVHARAVRDRTIFADNQENYSAVRQQWVERESLGDGKAPAAATTLLQPKPQATTVVTCTSAEDALRKQLQQERSKVAGLESLLSMAKAMKQQHLPTRATAAASTQPPPETAATNAQLRDAMDLVDTLKRENARLRAEAARPSPSAPALRALRTELLATQRRCSQAFDGVAELRAAEARAWQQLKADRKEWQVRESVLRDCISCMRTELHAAQRRCSDAIAYASQMRGAETKAMQALARERRERVSASRALTTDLHAAQRRCADAMAYASQLARDLAAARDETARTAAAAAKAEARLRADLAASQRRCSDALAMASSYKASKRTAKAALDTAMAAKKTAVVALKTDLTATQRRCTDAVAFAAASRAVAQKARADLQHERVHAKRALRLIKTDMFAAQRRCSDAMAAIHAARADTAAARRQAADASAQLAAVRMAVAPVQGRCADALAKAAEYRQALEACQAREAALARQLKDVAAANTALQRRVNTLAFEARVMRGDLERAKAQAQQTVSLKRRVYLPTSALDGCTGEDRDYVYGSRTTTTTTTTTAAPMTPPRRTAAAANTCYSCSSTASRQATPAGLPVTPASEQKLARVVQASATVRAELEQQVRDERAVTRAVRAELEMAQVANADLASRLQASGAERQLLADTVSDLKATNGALMRQVNTLTFDAKLMQRDLDNALMRCPPPESHATAAKRPLAVLSDDETATASPPIIGETAPAQAAASEPAGDDAPAKRTRGTSHQVKKLKGELELMKRQLTHLRTTAVKAAASTPLSMDDAAAAATPAAAAPKDVPTTATTTPLPLKFLNDPAQQSQIMVLKAELKRVRGEQRRAMTALKAEKEANARLVAAGLQSNNTKPSPGADAPTAVTTAPEVQPTQLPLPQSPAPRKQPPVRRRAMSASRRRAWGSDVGTAAAIASPAASRRPVVSTAVGGVVASTPTDKRRWR